jgi:hypothetical protein
MHEGTDIVRSTSLKLNTWRQRLPPQIVLNNSSLQTALPHQLMLHMAHNWLIIILHRPFCRRKRIELGVDHLKVLPYSVACLPLLFLADWSHRHARELRISPWTSLPHGVNCIRCAMSRSRSFRLCLRPAPSSCCPPCRPHPDIALPIPLYSVRGRRPSRRSTTCRRLASPSPTRETSPISSTTSSNSRWIRVSRASITLSTVVSRARGRQRSSHHGATAAAQRYADLSAPRPTLSSCRLRRSRTTHSPSSRRNTLSKNRGPLIHQSRL